MKSLKKLLVTFLLSATLLSGSVFSTTTFAYNESVEKKLDRISKNIDKQNKKYNKEERKRSSSGSTSTSTKSQKIKEKISDLEQEASDIKRKEDAKIAKTIKSIDARKKQSTNKISRLEKAKSEQRSAAQKKYDNDVKTRKMTDPTYAPPPFKFNSDSIDKQIALEKEKFSGFNQDVEKARGNDVKKKVKKK